MLRKIKDKTLYDLKISILSRIQPIIFKYRFAHIGTGTVVEKAFVIHNPKDIFIGNNVMVRKNARIEMIREYANIKYYPKLQIGDGTNIEFNVHISCAHKIIIERNVLIAGYVTIADTDHSYEDISLPIIFDKLSSPEEVVIKEESFIGMGARIMPGVCIGKHCVIGANSVVTRSIPDYCVAVGIPAKVIKKYDFLLKKYINV